MPPHRLFRWAGAKSHLVPTLAPILRTQLAGGGRLVSLFYGTGALEQTASQFVRQVAAEANPDLLAFYRGVVRSPMAVAIKLYELDRDTPRSAEGFASVRAMAAEQLGDFARAARFLWLSGFAFNGIWRVNRAGQFNVPADPGRLARRWPLPRIEDLEELSKWLHAVQFVDDWRKALDFARAGDVILSDPPYLGGFAAYTAAGFPRAEQHELAERLRAAAAAGAFVLAFNSPAAAPLYASWARLSSCYRSGRVSSRGSGRTRVRELVAVAGPGSELHWTPDGLREQGEHFGGMALVLVPGPLDG